MVCKGKSSGVVAVRRIRTSAVEVEDVGHLLEP